MKILVTDYDGTLKYAQQVMDEDLEAINRWKEAGNLYVIDTGRAYESIRGQVARYNIPYDYLITNNGGMVFEKDDTILFSTYLDFITSLDIIYIAKGTEGVVSYVVNDGVSRHRIIVNSNLPERRYLTLQPDLSEDQVLDMTQYAQITISMAETNLAYELAKQFNTFFSDVITAYANGFVVYIVPKGVSKATGLDFVCEFEDVSEYETYVMGDSYNDIAMIEYSPNGACISSAPEDVKYATEKQYDSIHDMINVIMEED